MLKNLAVITLTSLALSQQVFADDLFDRINEHGTITVGTEGTYKPFTYHNSKGKLTGYDVEVVRAIAKKLGVSVDFKETEWSSMLAGLKAGRFDMVANQISLTTPARRATFDKSAPYNYSGAMLIAHKNNNKINTLDDVKGKKSASSLNSHYGELAEEYGATVVPVDGMAMALKLIEQKRADITFNGALALLDYLHTHPNSDFKIIWESTDKRSVGLGLNKGHQQAIAKINQAIDELRKDGTLKKLGEQFFGKDVSVK